jgi:hypothetical protein
MLKKQQQDDMHKFNQQTSKESKRKSNERHRTVATKKNWRHGTKIMIFLNDDFNISLCFDWFDQVLFTNTYRHENKIWQKKVKSLFLFIYFRGR